VYLVNTSTTSIKGKLINKRGMKNKNERAQMSDKNMENNKKAIA